MERQVSDWRQNIIRDGVEQTAYIAEKEGIHGHLWFAFRPILGADAERYAAQVKNAIFADPQRGYKLVVEIVASHLTNWSEELPFSKEILLCLKKALLYDMYYIMRGEKASDTLEQPKTGDEIVGKS